MLRSHGLVDCQKSEKSIEVYMPKIRFRKDHLCSQKHNVWFKKISIPTPLKDIPKGDGVRVFHVGRRDNSWNNTIQLPRPSFEKETA